jgi:hypothetical protein
MSPAINWYLITSAGHIKRLPRTSLLARLGRWLRDHA